MANIGIMHYQLGSTDGVSLEVDKLKHAFESMGHKVYLAAGDLGSASGDRIEGLYHHSERAERLTRNTFYGFKDYASEAEYRSDLYEFADEIEKDLDQFVSRHDLDLLMPQNIWSVGMNPAAAIAIARVVRKRQLSALGHNHDFYWERKPPVMLSCPTAIELADKYLPPRDALIEHMVINQITQKELLARKQIDATVLPNVFDFEGPDWVVDDYNRSFRQDFGLQPHDVVVLQATRIIERKGIALAIDFVKALNAPHRRKVLEEKGLYDGRTFQNDSRIVLVLAGYSEDPEQVYINKLKAKIARDGVDALFISDRIRGERVQENGTKYYSLWDTYVFADLVTYPSIWEGWGNQLLETIRARLPFLLFEYPVFQSDIAPKGIQGVSLGDTVDRFDGDGLAVINDAKVNQAADEMLVLLTDKQKRQAMVESNFRLAREHFSTQSLTRYVGPSLERALKRRNQL